MHSSLFWYQGHLKLNILFTHPFVSEMCGNSTHRKQEPKQHKTTWGKENKMFNLVICSPPSFYHNTGSPKMLFPSLYHKFLSNDMWLPPCPRTATLLKAWKLHSLLCFKLSWQNPAGFRLDTHGCWRRSQISRGHSIVHKIQLFFFFFSLSAGAILQLSISEGTWTLDYRNWSSWLLRRDESPSWRQDKF